VGSEEIYMSVDIDLIKQKKKLYGDNFANWAQKACEELDIYLSPLDMVYIGVALKETRRKAIEHSLRNKQLNECDREELEKALEDTLVDLANYEWIADNFKEYKNL
jgi:hypothetical protein